MITFKPTDFAALGVSFQIVDTLGRVSIDFERLREDAAKIANNKAKMEVLAIFERAKIKKVRKVK